MLPEKRVHDLSRRHSRHDLTSILVVELLKNHHVTVSLLLKYMYIDIAGNVLQLRIPELFERKKYHFPQQASGILGECFRVVTKWLFDVRQVLCFKQLELVLGFELHILNFNHFQRRVGVVQVQCLGLLF